MGSKAAEQAPLYNSCVPDLSDTMTDDRKALRTELRTRRRAISAQERIAGAESLATRLLSLPFFPEEGPVAGYWAMDGEIALHVWQLRLPPTLTYCLPVLVDGATDDVSGEGRRLCFAPWRPGDPLVSNRYGIPEPDVAADALLEAAAMRLVVVPLVGFDARGQRLGMGAGWYDRSFAFRRSASAPPWLVGAGFSAQQVEALPAQAWDVALDAVCTENATHLPGGTAA